MIEGRVLNADNDEPLVGAEDGGLKAGFESIIPSIALEGVEIKKGSSGVPYSGGANGGIIVNQLKRGQAGLAWRPPPCTAGTRSSTTSRLVWAVACFLFPLIAVTGIIRWWKKRPD